MNSKFFAGHSLGEYTALVCAGSLTLEKAAYLLYERGKSMQEAVPPRTRIYDCYTWNDNR